MLGLLLFAINFLTSSMHVTQGVAATDRDASSSKSSAITALEILKKNVYDPLGSLHNWNSTLSLCEWDGVACSSDEHLLTGLTLASLSLSFQTLASALQSLPSLQHLVVRQSNFSGALQLSLERCTSLESVDLSTSNLSASAALNLNATLRLFGACPDKLKYFNLSQTQLHGELTGLEILTTDSLETLDLSNNALTGRLSLGSIQACKSLKHLDISANQLVGELPPEFFNGCSSLEVVRLAHNSFSGSLNITSACSSLTELNVAYNQLKALEAPCPSIKLLNLSSNGFTGTITSLFGGRLPPELEILDASYNGFTGRVPPFPPKLRRVDISSNAIASFSCSDSGSRLESLIFPNNRLTGRLLDSVVENCSTDDLKMLDVSFNAITGEIPANLCERLPALENLLLWANKLQGIIPPSLSRCENLTVLILGINNLHGTIPQELSMLRKLFWLGLGSNSLAGGIPSALGNLSEMVYLHLSDNLFEGEIPDELLKNAKRLSVLQLGGNRLSWRLPSNLGGMVAEIISSAVIGSGDTNLKLARGQLPSCSGRDSMFAVQGIRIEKFRELLVERRGCDSIVNFVPSPDVRSVRSLLLIDVSHNRLTGSIPAEIGEMTDLMVLNLADNLFSGQLPPALGNLRGLYVLDVSQNDLQGGIPQSFTGLKSVNIFNVSYNNLSGMIPQAGQVNLFDPSSYEGNPLLCGVPIRKCYSSLDLRRTSGDDSGIDGSLVCGVVFGAASFGVSAAVTYLWVEVVVRKCVTRADQICSKIVSSKCF